MKKNIVMSLGVVSMAFLANGCGTVRGEILLVPQGYGQPGQGWCESIKVWACKEEEQLIVNDPDWLYVPVYKKLWSVGTTENDEDCRYEIKIPAKTEYYLFGEYFGTWSPTDAYPAIEPIGWSNPVKLSQKGDVFDPADLRLFGIEPPH